MGISSEQQRWCDYSHLKLCTVISSPNAETALIRANDGNPDYVMKMIYKISPRVMNDTQCINLNVSVHLVAKTCQLYDPHTLNLLISFPSEFIPMLLFLSLVAMSSQYMLIENSQ